jgi:hypothetical protein
MTCQDQVYFNVFICSGIITDGIVLHGCGQADRRALESRQAGPAATPPPPNPACEGLPPAFKQACDYDLEQTRGDDTFALSARNASRICDLQACGCGDNSTCLDCRGVPHGGSKELACGCGDDESCRDCRGVPYGADLACRDCRGVKNGTDRSCYDCAGVKFGPAALVDGRCVDLAALPCGTHLPPGPGARPTPCPGGAFCPGGEAPPIPCAAGAFCLGGACNQTACPPGFRCPAGASAPEDCAPCSPGHYRGRCGGSTGAGNGPCWKCDPCGPGLYRAGCGGSSPGTCLQIGGPARSVL